MDHAPPPSGKRNRKSCAVLGAAYFALAFVVGGVVGLLAMLPVAAIVGRSGTPGQHLEYFFNNSLPMTLILLAASAAFGGWMGMRSYYPAACVASGKIPNPPFFTRMVADTPRGPVAMLSMFFVPRWQILTKATDKPWRMVPRILAGVILASAVIVPYFLGRDMDPNLAFFLTGGLSLTVADCLMVNQIVRWRDAGQLAPV